MMIFDVIRLTCLLGLQERKILGVKVTVYPPFMIFIAILRNMMSNHGGVWYPILRIF